MGDSREIKAVVREKYGDAARAVRSGTEGGCGCGDGCGCAAGGEGRDPVTEDLYGADEAASIPEGAMRASLGCGNPTALAELREGEVVLDLGSGGGADVLLSARRVGPTGMAVGVDMTEEMLSLARENAGEAGVSNVEFRKGDIEDLPLPDSSVDVVISNCVINLAADKRRVLEEAFRVLRPGGRFAVSDVVVRGELPTSLRESLEAWVGCVAGALDDAEFLALLEEVGFEDPEIEPTRVYDAEDARAFMEAAGLDAREVVSGVEGGIMAAFVRGRKPGGG